MGRIEINNKAEWLKVRAVQGIGGSETACIIGKNPYKSNLTLWQEKTGKIKPEDISEKPAVKYGKEAEKHIRALFALDYPEYSIEYHEFDILFNDDYPFIFCTLDGE
jgi:putative phage-type endonuclease